MKCLHYMTFKYLKESVRTRLNGRFLVRDFGNYQQIMVARGYTNIYDDESTNIYSQFYLPILGEIAIAMSCGELVPVTCKRDN